MSEKQTPVWLPQFSLIYESQPAGLSIANYNFVHGVVFNLPPADIHQFAALPDDKWKLLFMNELIRW